MLLVAQPQNEAKKNLPKLKHEHERELREKGFNSFYEYQKDLAKKKGFNSLYEYDKDLGKKRQEKSAYKRLGNLINYALEQIGKNRSWLAREINVSKQMISNYCYGKNYPSPEVLDRIYSALEFKGLLIDGKGLEGLL